MTLQDVAEQMAKEGGFDGVPDRMRHLINYDNILRHLKLWAITRLRQGSSTKSALP